MLESGRVWNRVRGRNGIGVDLAPEESPQPRGESIRPGSSVRYSSDSANSRAFRAPDFTSIAPDSSASVQLVFEAAMRASVSVIERPFLLRKERIDR